MGVWILLHKTEGKMQENGRAKWAKYDECERWYISSANALRIWTALFHMARDERRALGPSALNRSGSTARDGGCRPTSQRVYQLVRPTLPLGGSLAGSEGETCNKHLLCPLAGPSRLETHHHERLVLLDSGRIVWRTVASPWCSLKACRESVGCAQRLLR